MAFGRPDASPTPPLRSVGLLSVLVCLIGYTFEVLACNHSIKPGTFCWACCKSPSPSGR